MSHSLDQNRKANRKDCRYVLTPGTQVREEDFGLLFYTMYGPRLFFFPCGKILDSRFFNGKTTLKEWLEPLSGQRLSLSARVAEIEKTLQQLKKKGVILEC